MIIFHILISIIDYHALPAVSLMHFFNILYVVIFHTIHMVRIHTAS